MLLFHQTIFCPDENQFSRTMESLNNLERYIKDKDNEDQNIYEQMCFCFIGFCIDEFWPQLFEKLNEIKKIESLVNSSFKVYRTKKNFGKAINVNQSIKMVANLPFTEILLLDSDICICSPFTFSRLLEAKRVLIEKFKRPIGFLALHHTGNDLHWGHLMKNECGYNSKYEQKIEENFIWPDIPSGIAGSVFLTDRKCWEKIGGYRFSGVYCPDDACYLLACNHNNFLYGILNSLAIIHLPDNDKKYKIWKTKVCKRNLLDFNGDIKFHLNETDQFWRNHGPIDSNGV